MDVNVIHLRTVEGPIRAVIMVPGEVLTPLNTRAQRLHRVELPLRCGGAG